MLIAQVLFPVLAYWSVVADQWAQRSAVVVDQSAQQLAVVYRLAARQSPMEAVCWSVAAEPVCSSVARE